MMTEYDIKRISQAVIEGLVQDERFMRSIAKLHDNDRMITSHQAANILGVCVKTITNNAQALGGVKLSNGKWRFREKGLFEKFMSL